MNIVYLGSGDFGIASLDALLNSNHKLAFIITQPPQPAGRGQVCCPTPISHWAAEHSIPFVEIGNVNCQEIIEQISNYHPDLIVVIAFGQKLCPELTDIAPKGAINVHASLLPKYRGAAPINWAIINGETITGLSIITLADKMDAGKILAQSQTEILPDETAGELHDRLAQLAAPLLLDNIEKIESCTAVYTEQDHSKATLARKLKKSDGFLDFTEPAEVVARKIRGLWPWPGASADYTSAQTGKTVRVTVAMAKVVRQTQNSKLKTQNLPSPGTLDDDLNIICGKDALQIIRIKPSGSGLMDFTSFVNGRKTQPGDVFSSITH
jgi:methionyl-tRNA formyltransferase